MKSIFTKTNSMLSLEAFLDEKLISTAENSIVEAEEEDLVFKLEDLAVDELDTHKMDNLSMKGTEFYYQDVKASNINEAVHLIQNFNSINRKYLKTCTDNWDQEAILKLHSYLSDLKKIHNLNDEIKELNKRLSKRIEIMNVRNQEEMALSL